MKNNKLKHFFELVIQGLFWLLPIVVITMIVLWLYDKIDSLSNGVFKLIGFQPENNQILWLVLVIIIFLAILYILGHFMQTKLASITEKLFNKIPMYSTIKDIIGIFNSSKKGDTKVLVVAIRGFANEGYNIGLMYSQNESIIKDHYTITLSQTPIPNGGYLFEVHKDNIFIIEEAIFDDNLQYLLSMGVKSMADILNIKPKKIDELISLSDWLQKSI
jgi:uncharacterized membrane protein